MGLATYLLIRGDNKLPKECLYLRTISSAHVAGCMDAAQPKTQD
jgi:hypothetical protein